MDFADRHQFDDCMTGLLWSVISSMDDGFAEWQKGEHDRTVRHSKAAGQKRGGKTTTDRRTYKR